MRVHDCLAINSVAFHLLSNDTGISIEILSNFPSGSPNVRITTWGTEGFGWIKLHHSHWLTADTSMTHDFMKSHDWVPTLPNEERWEF